VTASDATLPARVARRVAVPGLARTSVALPPASVCALAPPPSTVAPAAVGVVAVSSVRNSRTVTVSGWPAIMLGGAPAIPRGNTLGMKLAASRSQLPSTGFSIAPPAP